tara:strand:- start:12108 stop:12593 length:486 start_codon:yes stop_codon:yes gene_type:complete
MSCDCSGNKILFDINYPEISKREWCDKCEPECEGPRRPKNVPIFNTTYVGRATRHRPINYLDYYDCKKQRGGNCGDKTKFKQICSAGRCETVPKMIKQQDYKYNITRHDQNYTGISKKMAYGRYARTTPGLETFSSKKVTSLQPKVQEKQACFNDYWCDSL